MAVVLPGSMEPVIPTAEAAEAAAESLRNGKSTMTGWSRRHLSMSTVEMGVETIGTGLGPCMLFSHRLDALVEPVVAAIISMAMRVA